MWVCVRCVRVCGERCVGVWCVACGRVGVGVCACAWAKAGARARAGACVCVRAGVGLSMCSCFYLFCFFLHFWISVYLDFLCFSVYF